MTSIKPNEKPKAIDIVKQLKRTLCPEWPAAVVGIRGYYKNMGKPGENDRGIYDDAIFLVGPDHFSSYNANTDPSRYREGWGTGTHKGMACLKAGVYHAHMLGKHRGQYIALVQRSGPVTVVRDGSPNYEETGMFGINIHRGGDGTTSSLGCQTIVPDQWSSFIQNVIRIMGEWKMATMTYILVEQ